MGDGSLRQDEIDALQSGAADATEAHQPETMADSGAGGILSILLNTAKEPLAKLIGANISIAVIASEMRSSEKAAAGIDGPQSRQSIRFSGGCTGSCTVIMPHPLCRIIAGLIGGADPASDPKDWTPEQQQSMIKFHNFFGTSLEIALCQMCGGEVSSEVDIAEGMIDIQHIDLSGRTVRTMCTMRIEAKQGSGLLLIESPFWIFTDRHMTNNLLDASVSPEHRVADNTNDVVYSEEERDLPSKIAGLVQRKGKASLRKKELLAFFDASLSHLERDTLVPGLSDIPDPKAREKTIVAALHAPVREELERARSHNGLIKRLPARLCLPLTVRFEDSIISIKSYLQGDAIRIPGAEAHVGKTGSLLMGPLTIASVRAVRDTSGALIAEIMKPGVRIAKKAMIPHLLDLALQVSVEIARIHLTLESVRNLGGGSIIAFDRIVSSPVDLVVDEIDAIVARGEVMVLEKHFGLRLTELLPEALIAVRGQEAAGAPSSSPTLPGRCILGRAQIQLREILSFRNGSIIELDRLAGMPVDFIVADIAHLKGEIVVINENFGIRIVPEYSGKEAEASMKETRTSEAGPDIDQRVKSAVDRSLAPVLERVERVSGEVASLSAAVLQAGNDRSASVHDELSGDVARIIGESPGVAVQSFSRWLDENSHEAVRFLIAIGADLAKEIVPHFAEETIAAIARMISQIESVANAERDSLFRNFLRRAGSSEAASTGGIAFVRDVIERSLGAQFARVIIKRISSDQSLPLECIRQADPSSLLAVIQGEHPQTIALILSYLDPSRAATIISGLHHSLQSDIARRIACMGQVPPEVLENIDGVMQHRLADLQHDSFTTSSGGIDAMVEILNNVDRGTEKIIIEALEEDDLDLAEEIKKRMFIFEDIVLLDDRSIQKVLRQVDTQDLAKALKGVDLGVQEKIFRNMSKRASSLLLEDMDFMGPIRLRDVEESQQKIVSIIRKLEESGEIIVARGGEEELIV